MSNVVSFVEPGLFEKPKVAAWPFKNDICELEPRAYSLVMIDPAWSFKLRSKKGEVKSPQSKYKCMTMSDIRALPVADLAHPDGCMFWIWCTAPMLDQQIECAKHYWGLDFVTSGTWMKTTRLLDRLVAGEGPPKGRPVAMNSLMQFGTGYVFRNCHEPYIICTRGNPEYCSKSIRSGIMSRVREHSRKPEEAYGMAKKLMPYGRAADVYTRTRRSGWEPFGDELDKFMDDETSSVPRVKRPKKVKLGKVLI